jgi:hypothetical protein
VATLATMATGFFKNLVIIKLAFLYLLHFSNIFGIKKGFYVLAKSTLSA